MVRESNVFRTHLINCQKAVRGMKAANEAMFTTGGCPAVSCSAPPPLCRPGRQPTSPGAYVAADLTHVQPLLTRQA